MPRKPLTPEQIAERKREAREERLAKEFPGFAIRWGNNHDWLSVSLSAAQGEFLWVGFRGNAVFSEVDTDERIVPEEREEQWNSNVWMAHIPLSFENLNAMLKALIPRYNRMVKEMSGVPQVVSPEMPMQYANGNGEVKHGEVKREETEFAPEDDFRVA